MQKIKSLFQRNYDGDRQVRNEIVPGSEWVANGEGWATRKWDGLALKIEGDKAFTRYDAKRGRKPPEDFVPCQPAPDPETGHWPGWIALSPTLRHIEEALNVYRKVVMEGNAIPDGTYEVCGPKIGTRHGANPENMDSHVLIPHGQHVLNCCPRTFDQLKDYFTWTNVEGVVWYHEDGRRVKLKAADFGIARKHGQL
jgi:hypothetical protein